MFWREPELPPVQKMPVRPKPKGPSLAGRVVAGLAGLAFAVTAAVSLWQVVADTSGKASPFGAFVMVLPTVMLLRYALTGQILKV